MWPFKRKRASGGLPDKLIFTSGQAFFEIQCKFGHTKIREGSGIVALVLDSREEFGTETAVKVRPDGVQLATLKVASDDGGFITFAETASGTGDALKPDDLVVWVPGIFSEQMAQRVPDKRSAWIGLIVAKIAPESDPRNNELSVICHY